ncbi:MAG: PASTA domain-containing protein [Candidatus Wallbacteria bacterium]|nr:PASTA domain-containing protein [Candidatus Wallbacteria bacterium]
MKKTRKRLTVWRFLIWTLLVVALGRTSYLLSVSVINYIFNEGSMLVPDLAGTQYNEARRILFPYQLEVMQAGTKNHPFLRAGEIISQDPFPGTKVKRGRIVKVMVSSGQENATVPDTRQKLLIEAEADLRNQGFSVNDRCYILSSTIAADHIIATSPEAGVKSVKNAKVDLLISKGSDKKGILIPDLTGKTLDQIKSELPMFKLSTRTESSSDYDEGVIIRQNPPASTLLEAGSQINVWVNQTQAVVPIQKQANPVTQAIPVKVQTTPAQTQVKSGRHYETISYQVPGAKSKYMLRMILTDEQGIREVLRQEVEANEAVNYTAGGMGKMKVMIYLDTQLVKELDF